MTDFSPNALRRAASGAASRAADTAVTRRSVLGGLASIAAAPLGCAPSASPASVTPVSEASMTTASASSTIVTPGPARMPAVFLPHGGGPWPFMDLDRLGMAGAYDAMTVYMEGLGMLLPSRPRALLVVSAHWEAAEATVMSAPAPPMLYDYSGFPAEAYQIQWPAPGAPDVAERTQQLLSAAGLASAADTVRGFDHGTFVPMMLAYPQADVPTFQLSLKQGLDPREHLAIGRALAPLRDEGVFMIGSGMSYHNMRGFRGGVPTALDDSHAFDDWLVEACAAEADRRDTMLAEWALAPAARACHPREEHLLPLMVIAGAAGEDVGTLPYRDVLMNAHISAAHFG